MRWGPPKKTELLNLINETIHLSCLYDLLIACGVRIGCDEGVHKKHTL